LGWQHYKEIFFDNIAIQFYGYQVGYAYAVWDYKGWLTLAPKLVVPVSQRQNLVPLQSTLDLVPILS
jgi:hypothetical protein